MEDLFQLTRVDPVTGIAEPIPARERVDAIIAHPRAREIIRSVDAQALYSLVYEAGLNDAYELVLYASGDQIQAIVDFDCWTRDELEPDRYATWLETFLQRDDDGFAEMIDRMDLEPMVVWLRESMQVFLWEDDRDLIDLIDAPVRTSPDGVYALVIPDDESLGPLIRLLLERAYAHDIIFGHRLLEAVRWELTADATEHAYQRRMARLGDLGFVPFHEALEVYATLDPPKWAARARAVAADPASEPVLLERGSLPPVDHQIQVLEERRFSAESSMFTRAMAALTLVFDERRIEAIADSTLSQFRALVNRVHVADLGSPGDTTAARRAADRADAYLSIGLQLASGDDVPMAARVLGTAPLKEIHRAGYSATMKLAQQARQLVERGNLSLTDARSSLLDRADADLVDGLLDKRPTLSGTHDTPFRTLADVETAARRVGEIAFAELVHFGLFRHTRDELVAMVYDSERCATPVEFVSFRALFATRMFRELEQPGAELRPLDLATVHRVGAKLGSVEEAHERLTADGLRLVCGRSDARHLAGMATAYAAKIAGWILDEFGDRTRPVQPQVASQVVLLAP